MLSGTLIACNATFKNASLHEDLVCDAVCAWAVIWSLLCQDKSFLLKIICYSVTNLSYAWLHLMHTVSDFLSDDLLNRLQKSRSDMQNIARRGFQMH